LFVYEIYDVSLQFITMQEGLGLVGEKHGWGDEHLKELREHLTAI